jgi:hypothetical protein
MCIYITIVLPASANLPGVKALAEAAGLGFALYRNPNLEGQLQPGELLIRATLGHCDCDTPLARLATERETKRGTNRTTIDEQPVRPARKGWSAAKLARWAEQKRAAADRDEHGVLADERLDRWLTFLCGALSIKGVTFVGLLVHAINHGLEDSPCPLAGRQSLPISTIDRDKLTRLAQHVLYAFYR